MAVAGVLPVVPTPFRGGAFDLASFERFLDGAIEWIDGYTLLGSTGEAPSLTVEERMRVCEAALSVTPPEKTVVVGVTDTWLRRAIWRARWRCSPGRSFSSDELLPPLRPVTDARRHLLRAAFDLCQVAAVERT